MCCVIPPASVSTTDGLADRVEQRRLAVVDVAHDRDDRRPRREIRLVVLEDLGLVVLLGGVLDRHLALRPRRRSARPPRRRATASTVCICAEAHQDLDDLRHRDAERLREVLDGDAGRDGDRPGRRDDSAAAPSAAASCRSRRLARVLARARGAGVDDDAALAAARRSALAGPDRAVRSVRTGQPSRRSSVEPRELRIDPDGRAQRAVERAPLAAARSKQASRRHV